MAEELFDPDELLYIPQVKGFNVTSVDATEKGAWIEFEKNMQALADEHDGFKYWRQKPALVTYKNNEGDTVTRYIIRARVVVSDLEFKDKRQIQKSQILPDGFVK
jgi:hypothetical protein